MNTSKSFKIQTLDPAYQVAQQLVKIEEEISQPNQCFNFGLWSKYNPLSSISQVGPVGIFGSNCYQLLNIIDIINNEIIFMYYDCLDNEKNQIKKYIKFVKDDGEQKIYEIQIEGNEYESFWYFLEIISWPINQQFEILIISQSQLILRQKIDEIINPFGQYFQITFGDSLIVSKSRIKSIVTEQKFSYFPGRIIIQKLQIEDQITIDNWFEYVKNIFQEYETCNCQPNVNNQIPDLFLRSSQKGEFVSEQKNCNSFILSGWFKIKNIINQNDEFIYPFIKIAANFENPTLSNKNLSPIQVFYDLSKIKNQIIVTTYSYTFPSVTIDFTNNPNLIINSFEILNSITVWHKIQIKLLNSQMDIQITFYDGYKIIQYSKQLQVRQFQENQFKLQFGNFEQLETNYLDLQINNFYFFNCDQSFSENNCHHTCLECDGPTKEDCLSCSEESKRIYLPEYKECICPINTIDNQICIGYVEAQLQLIEEPFISQECEYGYYELDNECYRCPSIISKTLRTCLECLQNPKSFSLQPFCHNDLHISQQSQTEMLNYQYYDYLLFNGIDTNVLRCSTCYKVPYQDQDYIYQDLQQKSQAFETFYVSQNYECIGKYISIVGFKCLSCSSQKQFENGECNNYIYYETDAICNPPYYVTSRNKCNLCPIKNCIYCFEYQKEDINFKSTLYKDFQSFNQDQMISIGCAMCEDGFVFYFSIGECLKQQSKISTCLRSFINLEGKEICTLSSQIDFSIAPEIINCQKYYSNCLQCVLTPQTKIQCIHCREGFVSSLLTGDCFPNLDDIYIEYTQSRVQGDSYKQDGWVLMIQSFMMQFLPQQYYYPHNLNSLTEFSIKCKEGSQLTEQYECYEYCSKDCINCIKHSLNFICKECSLNYYKQPIRVEQEGKCVRCSQLCEYCQQRTEEEIYKLNSQFMLSEINLPYTMKCIKPIEDPQVKINPYTQNVKYCFNKGCYNRFSFDFCLTGCILNKYRPGYYEEDIDKEYCNLIGVDQLTINFYFSIKSQQLCRFTTGIAISTSLKQFIFSLQENYLNLYSIHDSVFQSKQSIQINNFDSVVIQNLTFILQDGFIINNNSSKVDITVKNFLLTQSSFIDLTVFYTQLYGKIEIQNFSIVDSIIQNSKFFDFQQQSIQILLNIKKMFLRNCQLINSTLFYLKNNQAVISLNDIVIENCSFVNSSFFSLQTDFNHQNKIQFQSVEIRKCYFSFSYFLLSYSGFSIIASNLHFVQNQLNNSIILAFNDNLELTMIKTYQNVLIESTIISTLNMFNQQIILCIIEDYEDNQSTFVRDSSLITIYSSLRINNYIVFITNIKIQENQLANIQSPKIQLLKLHCSNLVLKNALFANLQNLVVLYLFEIQSVVINSIRYENSEQKYKIPLSYLCSNSVQIRNQLIELIGFQQLELSNIYIINQFSINYSLMDIIFSNQFISDSIKKVSFTNLQFRGNILLKNQQAASFSLLSLYSQFNLSIFINDIIFIKNFIHQQIDELLDTQISLLYLSSYDSFVKIDKIQCSQNAQTNSTNPYLILSANQIVIQNITVFNHNFLEQALWQQFYEFELQSEYNQNEMNSIVQSTLKILNQGIKIMASIIICYDSQFLDILAQKSSIFEIITKGQSVYKIFIFIQFSVIYQLLKVLVVQQQFLQIVIYILRLIKQNLQIFLTEWIHQYLQLHHLQNPILFNLVIFQQKIAFPQ
ncbi:unnamed protein product [Paramecium primaurelia]|uniref:Uncharacterized protein n=1 Tax=Paramecium primaurelia TaxID=5886 RepID=A0A8S1K3W6_PARPR|nr:unnamed protein product [Paramecium primaurelia]